VSDGDKISPNHGLWGGCKVAVTIVKASRDDARRELGAEHFSETPDDRKNPCTIADHRLSSLNPTLCVVTPKHIPL